MDFSSLCVDLTDWSSDFFRLDVKYFVGSCVRQAFGVDVVPPSFSPLEPGLERNLHLQPERMKSPYEYRALLITVRVTNLLTESIEVYLGGRSPRNLGGVVSTGSSSPAFEVPDRDTVYIVLRDSGTQQQQWAADFFNGIYQEIIVRERDNECNDGIVEMCSE